MNGDSLIRDGVPRYIRLYLDRKQDYPWLVVFTSNYRRKTDGMFLAVRLSDGGGVVQLKSEIPFDYPSNIGCGRMMRWGVLPAFCQSLIRAQYIALWGRG